MTSKYSPSAPDPQDQRNLLIALALTMLVIFSWKFLYADPQQQRAQQAEAARKSQAVAAAPKATPAVEADTLPQTREQALSATPRIRIDTPELHGSINLKGLRIDDVTLANYHETPEESSPEVVLLAPRRADAGYFAEFGWVGRDTTLPDANTLWQASHNELRIGQPVTFFWENEQGIRFEHEISIDEHYMFTITSRVVNQSGVDMQLAPYSLINRTLNQQPEEVFVLHQGMLAATDEQLHRIDYEEVQEERIEFENLHHGWAGITDKYWLTALVPDNTDTHQFTSSFHYYRNGGDNRYQVDVLGEPLTITNGETEQHITRFFAGAKEVDVLDAYAEAYNLPLFDRAIDFGTMYFLTRPLFEGLQALHALLGSFGLAILALTVVVKLLLFPLANKSYSSMSQMKMLMPKMKELRERYEDDRVKMNQEIMAMYKQEGVNPASGCLPVLIQIPVFFALYKVLYITIEMRHAPFYGWIEDLSVKDPTNLFTLFGLIPWDAPDLLHVGAWPLLMSITMIIQQRLNPKPADPTQAQIMAALPYLFLFVFATFPAGLVIYWTWNNILSIIQQYVITRRYAKLYDAETGKRLKPVKQQRNQRRKG